LPLAHRVGYGRDVRRAGWSAVVLVVVSACLEPARAFDPQLATGTFALAAPAPVASATKPRFGEACAAGWRVVADAGVAPWCDGFPETGRTTCGPGWVHAVGTSGCAPVGAPCPSGPFPEGLPTAGVRYVRAGAPSGGAGTVSAPFATVAEALLAAPAGTVVAVSKGTFDAPLRIPAGVTVRGACAAETVLTATSPAPLVGTVTSTGAGAAVEQLTLSGERPGAVVGVAGTSLTLRDVVIDGTSGFGAVAANGTTLTVRGVVVRAVRRGASGTEGQGLYAESGARIEGSGLSVEGVEGLGLVGLGEGSHIDLSDVVVAGGAPLPDGTRGNAVEVTLGATVTLRRFTLDDNSEQATYVARGGVLRLEDGVVRGTRPRPSDSGLGFGLTVLDEGTLEASRVAVVGNASTSVSAARAMARLSLTDVVVHDTGPERRSMGAGFGVVVRSGASATVQRLGISRARAVGLVVDAATLEGADVVVKDVLGQASDGLGGFGLQLSRGGVLTLERVEVEAARSAGVTAGSTGTVVRLADVVVRGTRGQVAGGEATGLALQDGADVTLTRAVVEGGEMLGVGVIAARLSATDLVIRDTFGAFGDGPVGRGLQAQAGAEVTGTRLLFERNREASIAAINAGTRVTLTEVTVRATLPRACAPACPDEGGTGVAALGAAAITLSRFLVEGNARCGLELGDDGGLDVRDGRVVGNLIGACVGTTGYDLERLSRGVVYDGNATRLGADFVPLPAFSAPRLR
jgi:hypothetical protein